MRQGGEGDQVYVNDVSQVSERFNRKLVSIQTTNTRETVATTSSSTQSVLPTVAPPPVSSRWNRVPPQQTAREPPGQVSVSPPGSRVPADKPRATPPVSRVKPMIRPTVAAQQTTTNQRSDISSSSNQSSSTSAHAPPSGTSKTKVPAPVVAARHHRLTRVADIPASTETLSVADVAKCVTLLGLSQQQADLVAKHGVDGRRLIQLSITDMTNELQFTPLEASMLARFARGWRPAT